MAFAERTPATRFPAAFFELRLGLPAARLRLRRGLFGTAEAVRLHISVPLDRRPQLVRHFFRDLLVGQVQLQKSFL
jgi:hypothetical protein